MMKLKKKKWPAHMLSTSKPFPSRSSDETYAVWHQEMLKTVLFRGWRWWNRWAFCIKLSEMELKL